MSTIILDDCIQNLLLVEETMKDWIPMTEYEVIFEAAEKEDTAKKLEKNEETATKSVGFLRKAINAVIEMIKKLYYAVKDFIDRITMSGEERKAFDAFRQQIADDPSLKNKKISVRDFRKINETYDKLINEIDQNIRAVKANEKHPIDDLISKVTGFLKNTAASAATIVAADAALKMADSNVEMARLLRTAIKQESGIMESLSKTLGNRDAVKFKKEIDAAAKNTLLHRLKVKLFRHKYDTLSDCLKGTITAFTHAGFRSVGEIKEAMKDLKADKKAGNISKEEYKKRKDELKDEKSKAKKDIISSISMDSKFLKNPYTGTIIKTVGKAAIQGGADLAKEKISDKTNKIVKDTITDREHKKRDKKGEYKPVEKFIFGK